MTPGNKLRMPQRKKRALDPSIASAGVEGLEYPSEGAEQKRYGSQYRQPPVSYDDPRHDSNFAKGIAPADDPDMLINQPVVSDDRNPYAPIQVSKDNSAYALERNKSASERNYKLTPGMIGYKYPFRGLKTTRAMMRRR